MAAPLSHGTTAGPAGADCLHALNHKASVCQSGRTATLDQWAAQLHAWMGRFRVSDRVLLAEDDQQLPLDLRQDTHLDLLRAHLDASPNRIATLHDAPPPDADGWIDGRAHSLVLPLKARS
ncbi:lantibiotic dehydratase [Streptomyces sp. NPDC087437]|uniref:lantibiotic dehydratase n=1 Tax=Streptomyces sp. NPDC087437 TaxID=3365789 RepID=UPI0038078BCF